MLERRRNIIMATAVAVVVGLAGAGQLAAEKQWKDRSEYDLYDAITKESNAAKRMELLNSWKTKYPSTEFGIERLTLYLNTYKDLNQAQKMVDTAKEILTADAKNFTAQYWITFLTPSLYAKSPTADQLDTGEKAGGGFLQNLDTTFGPDKKPKEVNDDQWKKTKMDMAAIGHRTLAWIAWQRKNYDAAEKEYRQAVTANPDYAIASLEWGQTIFAQKKVERQPEVLFHYARAASVQGPTALDPAIKANANKYVDDGYVKFHGGKDGLDELRAKAKAGPIPDGIAIKSVLDIEKDKLAAEEAAAKANPMLALWKNVKTALQAADGQTYFDDKMKGAALPGGANGVDKFKGKLISMSPETKPKELVLGIEDGSKPDVTLKLETALPGKMEPGGEIAFEGVAEGFSKEPFMVTFTVEKDKLVGWTGKNEAAPKKSVGTRKAVSKKK